MAQWNREKSFREQLDRPPTSVPKLPKVGTKQKPKGFAQTNNRFVQDFVQEQSAKRGSPQAVVDAFKGSQGSSNAGSTPYTGGSYTGGGGGVTPGQVSAGGGGGGATGSGTMPLGYTPLGMQQAFDTPEVIAYDLLTELGLGGNPELVDMLTPLVDAAWTLQYLLNAGELGYAPSAEEVAQWGIDYLNAMMTPGGSVPGMGSVFRAIGGADEHSLLGEGMAAGGPDYVNALVGDAVRGAGMNPYYQQGVNAMLDRAAQQYRSGLYQGGGSTPYYQSLASGPYGAFFGG